MVETAIERIEKLDGHDMHDLCDAAEAAIEEGGGFGWIDPPPRATLETFWRGVLLVPERTLFIGRLDGVIAGSGQLLRPTRNNEAQAEAATLTTNFVAPWARGHGLARGLTRAVEKAARGEGYHILNLDVRETQAPAIALYDGEGYMRWGEHPNYARVGDAWIKGYYYYKDLRLEDPA